jgi:hypothetical protein
MGCCCGSPFFCAKNCLMPRPRGAIGMFARIDYGCIIRASNCSLACKPRPPPPVAAELWLFPKGGCQNYSCTYLPDLPTHTSDKEGSTGACLTPPVEKSQNLAACSSFGALWRPIKIAPPVISKADSRKLWL